MIEFHETFINPLYVSAVGSSFHPPNTVGTTHAFRIHVVGVPEPFQFRYPDKASSDAAREEFLTKLRASQ